MCLQYDSDAVIFPFRKDVQIQMKKPNLLVIIIILAAIALVALLPVVLPQQRTIDENAPTVSLTELPTATPEATEVPAATEAPVATEAPAAESTEATAAPETSDAQATAVPQIDAYLILTVRGIVYEPLPLAGEGTFTIRQDENTFNTVHVTPTSIWMEHSSCDNQDCVEQGVVSLENLSKRVLYNMIICLPNDVALELHTPETLKDVFGLTE